MFDQNIQTKLTNQKCKSENDLIRMKANKKNKKTKKIKKIKK